MTSERQSTGHPIASAPWDLAAARRDAVTAARWVRLGSLGLIAGLWLAIFMSASSVRDAAMGRATSAANNMSAAFCEEVYRTLTTVGAAMDLTAQEIRADPSGFRLDRWARELPALAHPTMYVSLIGPDGNLISTTIASRDSSVNMSNRDYFSIHITNPETGLFVSVPSIGRVSKQLMLRVSKRVNDIDGKFLGVLVFGLVPDDLTALHRSVDIGARGVIALVGLDGKIRARFGVVPKDTTAVIGGSWPLTLDPASSNSVIGSSQVDDVPRIYALRRLPEYPLIVAAGLSLDDETSDARAYLLLSIGIGIAASLLLGALNVLLVREIRRRGQREEELAIEHSALNDARAALQTEQEKLAAVNSELLVSSARAESANVAKSRFLAQMSHELRTPLHAVIGFSELIAHHVAPLPDATTIGGYANDIIKSGRHLLELINSILDLSKVEAGSSIVAAHEVLLSEVLRDSATTIRQQAAEAGIAVDVAPAAQLPIVRGDTTKLRQIFINLMSNAVKFTPRGGKVTVSTRREPDKALTVLVTDNGIGMSEAETAIAMEPFGQVENTLARSYAGTGLGLPLARQMAELHGGRLSLLSQKGTGTTVEIWFPADRIVWPSNP